MTEGYEFRKTCTCSANSKMQFQEAIQMPKGRPRKEVGYPSNKGKMIQVRRIPRTYETCELKIHISYIILVEALRYKLEGRGFDSWWSHWNFSLTQSFQPHYGPGVDSASNRNEYKEYFLGGKGGRCVGLTTLPPSCANCLEIWERQPPGTLRASPGL